MKKLLFIFFTALTVFVNCNCQTQNAEQTDSVAKIIWETLKAKDESISKVISELTKLDKDENGKLTPTEFALPNIRNSQYSFSDKGVIYNCKNKDELYLWNGKDFKK